VWVPDVAHEALRDLVRAREAARQDQLRARHRLGRFLRLWRLPLAVISVPDIVAALTAGALIWTDSRWLTAIAANKVIGGLMFAKAQVICERRPDGTVLLRSPVELAPYPPSLSHYLAQWAQA